jgi:hypothetical protein
MKGNSTYAISRSAYTPSPTKRSSSKGILINAFMKLLFKKGKDKYVYLDTSPWLPSKLTNQANETMPLYKDGYKDLELNLVYNILRLHLRRDVLEHEHDSETLEQVPIPVSLDHLWKTYHLPEPNVRLPKTASPLEHVAWSLATQKMKYSHGHESLLFREEYLHYRLERIKETWLSYIKMRGLFVSV